MDSAKIGAFIASLRKEKGLTQAALAEKLNISNRTVSKWENGDGLPDISLLPLIAKEFDISVDELLSAEKRAETPDIKVTEIANKEALQNLFQIAAVISLFFALIAAMLGTFTNLYSIWAFSFLFYNHWEIIFDAVSFFSVLISVLIFTIGVIRLKMGYSKEQIKKICAGKGALIVFLNSVFACAFAARLIDHMFRINELAYTVFAVLIAAISAAYIVYLHKLNN